MSIEGKQEAAPRKVEVMSGAPEDVNDIQEVFRQTWLATYPNEEHGIRAEDIEDRYMNSRDPEIVAKRAEKLRNPSEGEFRLVAKEGGKVVGVAFGSQNQEFNRLNALYVLPEYQRKGVGGALWNEAQSRFDSTKDITLGVAEYNQNAIDFYASLGFEDTGKRILDERLRLKNGAIIPQIEMILRRNTKVEER